jgi:hypothetical protein
MGLSRYRRAAASGPSDTVYLGAFRTADLRRAGGWDEHFTTNQDFELNRRLGGDGTVWLDADLVVGYRGRDSLREVFTQYHRFGSWKVEYWRTTGDAPRPRQVALLVAPPVAAVAALAALSRPRAAVAGGVLACATAIAVEVAGTDQPEAGPAGHLVSLAAMGAVAAGWTTGVWSGILRSSPPTRPGSSEDGPPPV